MMEGPHNADVVITATYNEAENLPTLAPQVLAHGVFDLLVVDDNSPDGTGQVADDLGHHFPGRIRVLHRPQKQGLGPALLAGYERALAAGYEHIYQMDADLSHDPSLLPQLRQALERADAVIASRYVSGGRTVGFSRRRHLLSRLGSAYAGLLLGLEVHDLTGGYKGFRRQALLALHPESIRSSGYAFQIEVTYLLTRGGFRVVEVPTVFRERLYGSSKMSWRIVLEALRVTASLRLAQITPRPIPTGHV